MISRTLLTVLGALAGVLATAYAMRRIIADARGPAVSVGGTTTLRYGAGVRWLAAVTLAFAAVMLAIGLAAPPRPGMQRVSWVLLVVGFGAGSLYLLLAAARDRLAFDDAALRQHTVWGSTRALPWDAVERVRFSAMTGYLTIEGGGARVRASALMQGAGPLWDALAARLPEREWTGAREAFERYLRSMGGAA